MIRRAFIRRFSFAFFPLVVAACAASKEEERAELSPHSDRGGLGTSSLAATVGTPPPIDARRSLAVTEVSIVSRFSLASTLQALGASSGQSADALFRQLWDTQNPAPGLSNLPSAHCDDASRSLNGFPVPCRPTEGAQAAPGTGALANYSAIGLFNRFDLAPAGGANCGEHRIVFAKTSGVGRAFVIFEAVLPNPRKDKGLEGCRPVADFWTSLSSDASVTSRGDKLLSFYFQGLPGFSPVVAADNYGKNGGQVRLNLFMDGPWLLRETQLTRDVSCVGASCAIAFTPVTVKTNPFGGLFSANSPDSRAADFRAHFVTQVGSLAKGTVETFDYQVPDRFNAGASDAQSVSVDDYSRSFAGNTSFRESIAAELSRVGSPLTPENVVARAQALSCAGCHQRSSNADLGGGMRFPASAFFVHASELRESGPEGDRFQLSPALTGTFLPFRRSVLGAYLVADADADGVADAVDNCLGLANANQSDADRDGFGDLCDADLDQSGMVNAVDLSILRDAFGTRSSKADANGDGVVNSLDVALLQTRFGKAPGPSARR